ncbi:MAG: MFS transporter, partial [Endozoicomonas sp.]
MGHPNKKTPIITLLNYYRLQLVQGVFLAAVPATSISVLFYMPRYLTEYVTNNSSWAANSLFLFLFLAICCFIFAIISDRAGRIPLIRTGALMMVLLTPVSVYYFVQNMLPFSLTFLPLLISLGMINGVYEVSMVELFPTEARYSGVAFSHNLAFCLFGGATPMLLEWLCSHGWLLAPGILPAIASLILLALSFKWQDHYQDPLSEV